jgi:hypothetical protein
MSFLNLWWAVAVAAVVIPALLILYFLKLRRREELVPSTLLWKRAVQDLQVNAPFQRLRKNLLLFLQLLILAAAILALARPIVRSTVGEEERVVLLIDRSASMNTREGDQTRLDAAKEQAIRLVKTFNQRTSSWWSFLSFGGAKAQTRVMVIAFNDRASIISPFTTNTADLVDLIQRIEPTDGRTDLREALDLAEAYMAPPTRLSPGMESTPVSAEVPAKLILISDGRIANLDKIVLRSGTLELIRIGQAQDNVGITTFRTQRNYERPESLSAFMTVENFGPAPVSTDVSIYVDGVMRSVQSVTLAGRPASEETTTTQPAEGSQGSSRALPFDLVLDKGALLEARVSRGDALAVDNSAFVVVPPPRRQKVLVVTDGKYPFLDSVIRGLPLQEFPFVTPAQYETSAAEYATDGQSNFDVVIFDKYAPAKLPAGNYLFLGALPNVAGIEATGTVEKHPFVWWDETHPILRYVSLEYVYVAESQSVKVPAEAEVLAEGPQGPLLFRYAAEGRQYLVLTFAVENSTWWSKLSFGVFVYNAIRYLGGGEAEADHGPVRPGETLRVAIPPDTKVATLYGPDGGHVALVPDASGIAYYGGTERVGVYRAEGVSAGQDRFAVNLEDASESDIAPPSGPLKIDNRPVQEIAAIRTATPEVWRWFVGAALVLALVEWWIYNRRVMI